MSEKPKKLSPPYKDSDFFEIEGGGVFTIEHMKNAKMLMENGVRSQYRSGYNNSIDKYDAWLKRFQQLRSLLNVGVHLAKAKASESNKTDRRGRMENPTATDNNYAFACANDAGHQAGMTLRDYFAGQALVGILSEDSQEAVTKKLWDEIGEDIPEEQKNQYSWTREHYHKLVSIRAYSIADAMLKARKEGEDG